jgi:hypothetical protein
MRQRAGVFIVGVASALAFCWCGGSSFAPSRGADAGDEAAADSPSENVIIVGPPDASGVDGESDASCTAPTSQLCNGTCVDPTQAPHCGSSCTVCPGPDSGPGQATCTAGECTLGCSAPTSTCGGSCVDEQTDPKNCGGCGQVCTVPTNGMAACVAGLDGGGSCGVACSSGFHPSGASCNATCASNSLPPSSDPCVVANGLGTFVAQATGNDAAGCGATSAAPCKTVAYAMGVAAAATRRVYACGTFTIALVVPAGDDGVTVFGGLDCATWAYSASTPTTTAPTAAGPALQVTGTNLNGVTFVDFVFTAQSAPTTPSATPASSIAVFASGAALTLTRVAVNAGDGQPGSAGGTGSNYSATNAPSGSAPKDVFTGGVGGGPNICQDGTISSGGTGGYTTVGMFATPGTPIMSPSNAGQSGNGVCVPGGVGVVGIPPSLIGIGATSSGSVSASGWTVGASGGTGGIGGIGQGGGGGGANVGANGGAGGGGGAGGCGGAGGTGGHGGGASIGILSFQSTLTATASTISTGAGGSGGAGGPGQGGQPGGDSGAGGNTGNCVGGNGAGAGGGGGNGGSGAGGGGGAGGLSAGIVWSGTTAQEPSFNGMTYTTQAAPVSGITLGAQGPGGGNGSTPAADAVFKSN